MITAMKSTVASSLRFSRACGLVFFLLCCAVVQAQNPTQPKRGFYPAGSYALSDVETINTTNGNVIFRVPLASLPAGRGGLSAGVGLFYNSKIWETYSYQDERFEDGSFTTILRPSKSGGWRYGVRYEVELVHRYDENHPLHPLCNSDEGLYVWKLKMKFPDGSEHIFRPAGYTDQLGDNFFRFRPDGWMANGVCQPDTHEVFSGMTYYSADGTFMRLTFAPDGDDNPNNNAWTLSLPDGSRVTGAEEGASERIYDRNNNYVEIRTMTYNNDPQAIEIVDQLGRHIIVEHVLSTGRDYIHTWRTNENGQLTELMWTIQWQGISVTSRYYGNLNDTITGSTFGPEGSPAGISQITLPTQLGNLSYTFTYDTTINAWGEVSSMTLPSGAQVNYRYATNSFTGMAVDVLRNYPYEKELIYQREYDGSSTPVSELWQYSLTESFCQITAPDQGITKEYFKQTNVDTWDSGLVYKTENPDGSVVERFWQQNIPYGYGTSTPAKANSYLKTEYTSIRNAAGALVKTTIKDHVFDKNGNLTQQADYDWVDYLSVPRDGAGKPSGALPFSPQRVTVNTYYNPTPSADSASFDQDIYTQYTAKNIRNAMESGEARSGFSDTTTLSRTEMFYDDSATTGNLIQQKSWDSTKGGLTRPLTTANSVSVSHQYDTYGNLTLTTDASLHQTQFLYGLIGSVTDLYPTQIKTASNTSVVRTETREYDFNSGLVTRATDFDNNVSNSTVYDVFGRPVLVRAAEGKPEETRTATEYSDVNRRVIVRSDLNSVGDGKLVAIQHYDQLGRIRLTRQLEDAATQSATDETTGIKVQTRYMFSGSNTYHLVSNPYRAAVSSSADAETSMGWIRSKSDNGGRLIEVQTFGGAVLPSPWGGNSIPTGAVTTAYNAEFTTVTDQNLRVRRSRIDGLGRLARVDEPDKDSGSLDDVNGNAVQPTDYLYDALGNLRLVTQGQQQRFFMYDSLSRLIRASNPEQQTNPNLAITDPITGRTQWCMAYDYDNSGNLLHKTDARGVLSTFAYDALNRNISVVYTNDPANTPAITRAYDTAPNGKGRLRSTQTSGATGSLTTIGAYDALGRPTGVTQTLGTQNYSLTYTYDLAGHAKTTTYPSGHTVTNNYDNAGRTSSFTGNLGDGTLRNYATNITYAPFGGLSQEQLGTTTPIYNKLFYNSRGQLAEIREGLTANDTSWQRGAIINFYSTCWGMCFGNSMTDNNGNLKRQEYWIPDTNGNPLAVPSQQFDYDQLNRLKRVYEGATWQQQYVYDRYGNRTIDQTNTFGTGIPKPNFGVDANTNRLTAPAGSTMNYDVAGNLTFDNSDGIGSTRTYDAENRMTGSAGVSPATYAYDGNGQRVRRNINNVETWQVYGLGGELLAEYAANTSSSSPQKEYGYRNGQLLITATVTVGWGSPPVLNDNPLLVGTTTVQSRHITELRDAINALRSHLSLSAYSWQTSAAPGDLIKADPILEMRTALDQALGAPSPAYSAGLAQGQPIKAIHIQELRDRVLAAWANGGTDIRWLVPDQLGTPRMTFDQSGSLASVSRHDYLPFGEDLTAAGRGSGLGYGATDGARQKFTSKERDNETGLDFFEARYYSSTQGRFTSPDEFTGGPTELFAEVADHNPTFYAELADPQTLNKYHYARNNPLRYVDPDGHQDVVSDTINTVKSVAGFVKQAWIGEAQGIANIGIGINNIGALGVGDPKGLIQPYEPKNAGQAYGQHTIAVLSLGLPLLSEAGPASMMMAESKPAATAAADTTNAEVAAVHGNSLKNPNPTHVYRIDGPQGLHKIGESARGVRAGDGASVRAESQVRQLARQTGGVYTSTIIRTLPNKAAGRAWEANLIRRYVGLTGQRPPGNSLNR